MMDRYKFRGKRLDNGEWVFGSLIIANDGKAFITKWEKGAIGYWHSNIEVDQTTIGQYTGLKDKNGKKGYVGDIGEQNGTLYEIVYREDMAYFGVKIIKSDVVLVKGLTFPLFQYIVDFEYERVLDFRIIGNKVDNPELLEG